MALIEPIAPSWCQDTSALVLSDIVSKDKSVTVWKRPKDAVITRYFEQAYDAMGLGVRRVLSMDNITQNLSDALPDEQGKDQAIEDMVLLSDMLTCLFDCDSVGLRLVPLSRAMCPNFHTDKIQVRLVNTYLGKGTQWLPKEAIQASPATSQADTIRTINAKGIYNVAHRQQLNAFDVALLKGSAWQDQEEMAAIHRSCAVEPGEKRVLLTLDPVQS